jgi:Ca2+-binding RTX toxin-like protein
VYSGPRADYDLDNNGATLTVFHARNLPPCCADQNGAIRGDGTDTLRNVERLQFSDQVVEVSNIPTNGPPTGTVTLSTSNPVENQPLTATRAFNDPDGVVDATVEFTWQALLNGTWTPVFTGASFTPTDNEVGSPLRVLATFTDGDGVLESVTSAATANVANVNDVPTGVPAVLDLTPQEGVAVSVSTSLIADGDGLPGTLNVAWQASTTPTGNTFAAIPGATSASFTPAQAQVNRRLRVRVTFVDAHGTSESVVSAPTGVVGDMFVGTSGADTWTGTAGDDRAFGGGGADNLNAGNGDDVLAGEAGNDLINAGGGNDTIQFTGTSGGFDSVTGGAGSDAVVATVADTHIGLTALTSTELVSAEALVGSGVSPGVRVVGSAGNETITFAGVTMTGIVDIDGAAGNDTLTGTPSADVLLGSDGTDTLTTNGGNDIANGGAGTDTISTGAGDDQATGGAGDDAITPGTGNDLVRYETGVFGADTITGFDANPAGGQDLVDLSDRGITTATFGATVSIGPAPAGGTLITISGNTIRLVGVAPTTVTASDFRLAAP